jgi:septal ring-binding cell division protein DamX
VTVALSAVLLLGVAAGGYWYWQQRATASTAGTTPPEPTPTTTMAAASATLPPPAITPATTPVVPATTAGAPPAATPTTTLAAAPVAPTPTRPAAATATDPRALLREGNYPEAGRRFFDNVRNAPAGTATIQLLVACSGETIQKALAAVPDDDLFIVPFNLNGRACYRVLWGLYPSPARASGALGSLPGYFRDAGAKPRVVAAAEIGP